MIMDITMVRDSITHHQDIIIMVPVIITREMQRLTTLDMVTMVSMGKW